jgi:tRNA threonylcarbamoyladenosine modification (KEOPS) complex  Pcc1 subunit
MKHNKFNAEAEVDVVLRSRRQLNAIATALAPETLHPAGDKAEARIIVRARSLEIKLRARDSSSLRAIMSSYLRMLKATVNVCQSMLDVGRRGNSRGVAVEQ